MYGYQPPQDEPPQGTWGEIFHMTWVVLGLLFPPLAAIFAVLFLLGSAVWLLAVHPALSLLPVAVLGGGIRWMVERDKKAQAELEEEIFMRRRP